MIKEITVLSITELFTLWSDSILALPVVYQYMFFEFLWIKNIYWWKLQQVIQMGVL